MISPEEYVQILALGLGAYGLLLAPLLFAAVVAFWPGNKPNQKSLFVAACASLGYGSGVLVEAVLSPFEMVAIFLAPYWEDRGYETAPAIFAFVAENAIWPSIAVAVVVSIWAPLHLRKFIWPKLFPIAA